ncbi:MAG: hypothetical protein K1X57_08850 [Gemmataceae bacterium]|nr:hypothetical protein [Gemmataceae bacterium]
MSEPAPVTVDARSVVLPRSWKIGLGAAVVMVLLAILGIGLSTTNRAIAPKYWLGLVPVYGMLCVGTAWYRARHGQGGRTQIIQQVVHWLAIAAAIGLDFLIRSTGEDSNVAAGFNALLLLALGCFLAGIHLEWMFMLVGVLLALTLVVAVKAEQYLWLLVLAGIAVIAVMFIGRRLKSRFGGDQ